MLRTIAGARPRALFTRALLLIATVVIVLGDLVPLPARAAATTLRQAAPRHFVVGTAVSNQAAALTDARYNQILAENFGSVTPDMAFKWGIIHPSRNVWAFDEADKAVARARANKQLVRGHTLLWNGALPSDVKNLQTCADARAVLKEHITGVVGHFRGRIWQWDVANELFENDGSLRQSNPFLRLCGPSIVADAFRWAHAADPHARLYLNEYGTLEAGPKAEAEYALVRRLWAARVPIHGVGFQAHQQLTSGVPASARAQFGRYARMRLETMITEADVRMRVPLVASSTDTYAKQAAVYTQLLDLCLKQAGCKGFTVWGFTDRFSWVAGSLPGQGNACLMDANMVARPAWDALRSRLARGR